MALLVNSPFWLSSAFGTIKSILPENTQADILSSLTELEGMRQYIDDDQIPKEFGGSSPYKLGEHPFEKELQNMVEVGMNNDFEESDEADLIRHDEALLAGGNGQQHASFDIPEHMHLHTTIEFKDEQIYQDLSWANRIHLFAIQCQAYGNLKEIHSIVCNLVLRILYLFVMDIDGGVPDITRKSIYS